MTEHTEEYSLDRERLRGIAEFQPVPVSRCAEFIWLRSTSLLITSHLIPVSCLTHVMSLIQCSNTTLIIHHLNRSIEVSKLEGTIIRETSFSQSSHSFPKEFLRVLHGADKVLTFHSNIHAVRHLENILSKFNRSASVPS